MEKPFSHPFSLAVPTTKTTPRPTVILATVASILIAVAVFATAATVIVATDVTRGREGKGAHFNTGISLSSAKNAMYSHRELRLAIDSLIEELGLEGKQTDSVNLRLMAHLWQNSSHPAWIARADSALVPLRPPQAEEADIRYVVNALRADPNVLPDRLNAVLADTASAWVLIWRDHARTSLLPALWGYRKGLPGVANAFDVPARPYSAIRQLALINELAGRVSLLGELPQSAIRRGVENLAASRHYMDSPILRDHELGREIAIAALRLIEESAGPIGNDRIEVLARRASILLAEIAEVYPVIRLAVENDAIDPASPVAVELFEDDKLPFAVRYEVLFAVLEGGCNHTSEVLFGFNPERENVLSSVASDWSDHPVLGEGVALLPSAAKQLRTNPLSLVAAENWNSSSFLDFLLPESVMSRVLVCSQAF